MNGPIAVIGGGYAGFAAAITLADANCSVTVFEAARTVGGRARRLSLAGSSVDNGQHILLGAYRQTLALLRTVHGARSEHELLDRRRLHLEQPGVFRLATWRLPAPLHLASALLTARGLTWGERLTTVAFVRRIERHEFRCAADMSVAALLEGQPAAAVHLLWEPLCLAALNTPIASASAQVFLNVLRAAFAARAHDADLLLPRVDLSTLFPDAAAAYVASRGGTIRVGERVDALRATAGGIRVATGRGEERFSAAVIAVGPHQLSHLSADNATSAVLAQVAALAYEPICTAYLQYPRALMAAQPMLKLDNAPGQWLFDRGQLGGPQGLAAVMISSSQPCLALSQEQLARDIDAQLRRMMVDLPAPSWSKVVTERRATYACVADRARPTAGPIAPHLYLAGDYTDQEFPATLEAATRSGVAAARALLGAER